MMSIKKRCVFIRSDSAESLLRELPIRRSGPNSTVVRKNLGTTDFHLHYVGSAAEHGVKQRLLNPHHIIERLACTADVYRSGAKIGFELCALPLRAEVHFGFNNIESSDDLIGSVKPEMTYLYTQ